MMKWRCILTFFLIIGALLAERQIERTLYFYPSNEIQFSIPSIKGSVEILGSAGDSVIVIETLEHRVNLPDNLPESTLLPIGSTLEFIPGKAVVKGVRNSYKILIPDHFSIQVNEMIGSLNLSGIEGDCNIITPGGDLTISQIIGHIDIFSGGGEILLESINGTVKCISEGGLINIAKLTGGADILLQGGDIFLETLNGNVDIESHSGNITIRQMASEILQVKSGGGSIDIKGVFGNKIELFSQGGSINLENIEGSVKAQTSSGEITGRNIHGTLCCSNSGGTVEIDSIRGTIDCTTIDGNITVTNYQPYAPETGISKLQTSRGDIALVIMSDYANVDASTSFGKIMSEYKGESNVNQRRIKTSDPDASVEIIISTISGDIYLNKGE